MAEEMGEWALCVLLKKLSPHQRAQKLEEIFLKAAERQDDKAALAYFSLSIENFHDIEIASLREEKGDEKPMFSQAEVEIANLSAEKASTLKTMELYGKLAGFRMGKNWKVICEAKSQQATRKEFTLLETKKAMLAKVASRWYDTKDEEEADYCFQFLYGAIELAKLHEEDELLQKTIRETTSKGFPLNRLVRHILLLPLPDSFRGKNHKVEAMRTTLAIAWARNSEASNLTALFRSVQPVLAIAQQGWQSDASGALELLGRNANEIARLDASAKELMKLMQPGGWPADKVPGQIKISYPDIDRISILVEVEVDPIHHRDWKPDDKGHEWFELARDHVLKWCEQYRRLKVSLKLLVNTKYGDKPSFVREQNFG